MRRVRIYVVKLDEKVHMVRAATAAQATARAMRDVISVHPASTEEVFSLAKLGLEVLDCDDEE